MENLIVYLVKSSTLLLLFFTTYHFLLKKNTFFTSNRWFLLCGIFCAPLLPLLTFQKTVWVEPVISPINTANFQVISMDHLPLPVEENFVISWELVVGLFYGIGVLIFLTQLLIEFYSLRKIIQSKSKIKVDGFELIEIEEAISPFSFFKKIVYNRNLFQPEELHNIIEHEKIHAKQLHSLDVLIARIYCILFWWNPLIWFYKKAMIQNLEFIADQNALAKAVNKKSYLLTLLKITTAEKHVAITNHFYQSLIKKRIVMLHTNQSKKYHSWKYFIVLPALIFFMLTYQVEVVAQEKPVEKLKSEIVSTKFEMMIKSSSTEEDIISQLNMLQSEFGITGKVNKISRTKEGKIKSIKIVLTHANGLIKNRYVSNSEPIQPFLIFAIEDESKRISFGFSDPSDNPAMVQNLKADAAFDRSQNGKANDSIYFDYTAEKSKNISLSTSFSISINANSTDEVLKSYKKILQKRSNIEVKFNTITRNANNEITEIDVTLKNRKGVLKSNSVAGDAPIKPFSIFVKTDENQEETFGFSASQDNPHMKQHFEAVERSQNKSQPKEVVLMLYEKDGQSMMKSAPESEVSIAEFAVSDKSTFPKNTLFIVDDKITSKEEYLKLDPNSIKSVTVIKKGRNADANHEALFKKYGKRAENGIIDIKMNAVKEQVAQENNISGYKTSSPADNIVLIMESKDVDYKKAFISLNGIEISSSEMEKIKPTSIETVMSINGGDNSRLVAKYGEKARNGVILIEKYGYKKSVSENEVKEAGKSFKVDSENGGFTLHKRSKKGDFEFYEKQLLKIGVIVKISGVERNSEGFITAIKIKLVDTERNHKMSENWTTSKNANGIPDISIGRKKGTLNLNAL
ncbi:M56 family metallopeptidase [Flavobacterium tegetincola]|uniref:M56 family metallopeptidase n=1 Tax=Flavobacterium tegetincola TaxID=150172 RepID=UPI00042A5421|nr:M56 family metallopeptidase [Flavobacterium tegetincola]